MTPLYDYNISVIIGNYLLRALANDEDLNLNSKKSNFFTKLFRKCRNTQKRKTKWQKKCHRVFYGNGKYNG